MRRKRLSTVLVAALIFATSPIEKGRAQPESGFGSAFINISGRNWIGKRTPFPKIELPPSSSSWTMSSWPVQVHGPLPSDAFLNAMEQALIVLQASGWPIEELWLNAEGHLQVEIRADASPSTFVYDRTPMRYHDSAVAALVLPPQPSEQQMMSGLLKTLLITLDPAESRLWRNMVADYAAGILSATLAPPRSSAHFVRGDWLRNFASPENPTMIAQDIWQLARQRTWDGDGLRDSPTFWEAFIAIMKRGGYEHNNVWVDLIQHEAIKDLPRSAETWSELPHHFQASEEIDGRSFVTQRIDVSGAKEGDELRVWLKGEYGVGWAMQLIRLDAKGNARGALSEPSKFFNPNSFLSLHLESDTDSVLIVGVNMAEHKGRLSDPSAFRRAVRFTADRFVAEENKH